MTSSDGNIFRVTGHLCGNYPVTGEFPAQRPVARSFDVFFDLHLNKQLSKQSWDWWFETPSCPLWRRCNSMDHTVSHCVLLLRRDNHKTTKSPHLSVSYAHAKKRCNCLAYLWQWRHNRSRFKRQASMLRWRANMHTGIIVHHCLTLVLKRKYSW